jgi:hypothetical protein
VQDRASVSGYCYFIGTGWAYIDCGSVHDAGREYEFGGEYVPYQFEELATGVQDVNTTIYFMMSTWNVYTVQLD